MAGLWKAHNCLVIRLAAFATEVGDLSRHLGRMRGASRRSLLGRESRSVGRDTNQFLQPTELVQFCFFWCFGPKMKLCAIWSKKNRKNVETVEHTMTKTLCLCAIAQSLLNERLERIQCDGFRNLLETGFTKLQN